MTELSENKVGGGEYLIGGNGTQRTNWKNWCGKRSGGEKHIEAHEVTTPGSMRLNWLTKNNTKKKNPKAQRVENSEQGNHKKIDGRKPFIEKRKKRCEKGILDA